ncbi:hypothetical protein J3D55_004071 [Chryseobacterium ginsenosidimutans]|uniref:hypothetical protein n=1 Tax=Chryseobacterium ginsenosidimutans TaxID=687846 RepID=UPI00216A62E5|nr:hypothetical protein [Chryseobacterium ginsenosidimutans]MCS3871155.1 hypothetical protein [Chryseobacterium ginsenosidimutans]
MSRQLDDLFEQQSDEHIAKLLGITLEEFQSLEHSGVLDNSSDDGQIYEYYIEFDSQNPKEILNKITGINSSNTVYFSINDFDEHDDLN